jgi:hypothetical protein
MTDRITTGISAVSGVAAQGRCDLPAVSARHDQVEHDGRRPLAAREVDRLLARQGRQDPVPARP